MKSSAEESETKPVFTHSGSYCLNSTMRKKGIRLAAGTLHAAGRRKFSRAESVTFSLVFVFPLDKKKRDQNLVLSCYELTNNQTKALCYELSKY